MKRSTPAGITRKVPELVSGIFLGIREAVWRESREC